MATPDPYFDENRPHHLRAFEIGYDLDGGGYTMDLVEDFGGENAVGNVAVWENPDCDYFPFMKCRHGDVDMLVFDMNSWPKWPKRVEVTGTHYALIEDGSVTDSDHECNCHGMFDGIYGTPDMKRRIAKAIIAAIPNDASDFKEIEECLGEWEWSGDSSDPPHPFCQRCEGDGYVLSPGGGWAVYKRTEVPTDVNLQAVIDCAVSVLTDLMSNITALDGIDDEDADMLASRRSDYEANVNELLTELTAATDEDDRLEVVEKLLDSAYLFRYRGDHINGRGCYITYDPAYACGDGVTRQVVILSAGYSDLVVREIP